MGYRITAALDRIGFKAKALDEWASIGSKDDDLIQASPGSLRRRSQAVLYLLRKLQKFNEPGSAVKHGKRPPKQHADAPQKSARAPPDVSTIPVSIERAQQLSKTLCSPSDSHKFAAGSLVFGLLLFICGAAPWALPGAFLLFFLTSIPHRIYSFHVRKWDFFLADFCYWANVITVVHLLWWPAHRGLEDAVYALTDGPLAGALIVWQCAWVFGSGDHAVSVLVHLLPGLAMFAQRRYVTPEGWRQWLAAAHDALVLGTVDPTYGTLRDSGTTAYGVLRDSGTTAYGVLGDSGSSGRSGAPTSLLWLFGAPLLFYCTWQLCYFVVVQVVCRRFILRNDYDTSYNCLARRAARTNNIWNRIIRRGSIAHRCVMYGLVQLTFTLVCLLLFLPTYHYPHLAFAWQAVKFAVSVYFGSVYQCQKVPQHAFMSGMRQLQEECQQPASGAAAAGKPPAAGGGRRSRKSGA